MPAQVSGRAFLGLIRIISEQRGKSLLQQAIDASGEAARPVFAERVRILSWHPYAAYVAFLTAIDRTMGTPDGAYCRKLGTEAGKRDLGTVLRVLSVLASPERLIRSSRRVWESYYRDAGRMEAAAWEPENTVLRILDFPEMHPSHCRLMEGWMMSTMATIGCVVGEQAMERLCPSRGGPHHEFFCTWSRR
jgi:hypothetical protein